MFKFLIPFIFLTSFSCSSVPPVIDFEKRTYFPCPEKYCVRHDFFDGDKCKEFVNVENQKWKFCFTYCKKQYALSSTCQEMGIDILSSDQDWQKIIGSGKVLKQ